jgi:hypothetical protein
MDGMKKVLFLTAIAAGLAVFGCGGGGGNSGGAAFLRVVHASHDTGSVDVEINDAPFGTVAYQGSSPSSGTAASQVGSGLDSLTVLESGTSNVLLDLSPTFEGGHIYTALVAGLTSGIGSDALNLLVVDEPKSSLSTTKANLQFVNASTLMNGVDIYVTGTADSIATISPTIAALSRYGTSDLVTVAAGSFRVRICPTGSKTPTIDLTGTAVAGTYTVDVTENNDTNTGSVLEGYSGAF